MLSAFQFCEAKSAAPESSHRLYPLGAQPLTVYEVTGFNSHASNTLYWQLFNAIAVPANGTTPDYVIQVPALQSFAFEPLGGFYLSGGGIWCASSTAGTLTLATANLWALVKYLPELTLTGG